MPINGRNHFWGEIAVGHAIRIQSDEQYIAALRVLDNLPGTWAGRGSWEEPILLVTDAHYKALVEAGVVPWNGKKDKLHGKKTTAKKKNS